MQKLVGAEFHRYLTTATALFGHAPGTFFRVVSLGKELHLREGLRGTPGTHRVYHFDTADEASAQALKRIGYAHNDIPLTERALVVFHVHDDEVGLIDPEQRFLNYWTHATFNRHAGEPIHPTPRWVLVKGALAERDRDTAARAVLDEIESHPHAVDSSADVVVGLVPRLPVLHPDSKAGRPTRGTFDTVTNRLTVLTLADDDEGCVHGPTACAPCGRFMAELLAFLCRGTALRSMGSAERQLLADTARRLMRNHATPAPV